MSYDGTLESIRLDGGLLCLDFVNTVNDRSEAHSPEYYHSYEELVAWAVYAGALGPDVAESLQERAHDDPEDATRIYAESKDLREALFRIFCAAHEQRPAKPEDLDRLNRAMQAAFAHLALRPNKGTYEWQWTDQADHPGGVLWPIVRSAVDLLTTGDAARLKACPSCEWLYYDTSRNASRRWCSMETCGNRAKVTAHYQRSRGRDDEEKGL